MLSIVKQIQITSWLLGTGALLGLGYHLYNLLRRDKGGLAFGLDLLFLSLMALLLMASLYLLRWGEVRLFYFLLVSLGFLLYQIFLLPLFKRLQLLSKKIFQLLVRKGS